MILLFPSFQKMIQLAITKYTLNNNTPIINISSWYDQFKYNLRRISRRFTIGHHRNLKQSIFLIEERLKSEERKLHPDSDLTYQLYFNLEDLKNQAHIKTCLNAASTSAETAE